MTIPPEPVAAIEGAAIGSREARLFSDARGIVFNDVRGIVFNIQRFCVHDGPGIRTTVFLKGCPLRCAWCHNPESHEREPEIAYYQHKCVGCGACALACPHGCHTIFQGIHTFDRSSCSRCGLCASACVYGALSVIGRTVTAGEVMAQVARDEPFYRNSGGGMTLSGGEPFAQIEFTLALLNLAKETGLHTCVETSGYTTRALLLEAAALTDIFLYDIKETDAQRHKVFTGAENQGILDNLAELDRLGARIVLRCPIIPGINDREDHFRAIAELANRYTNVDHIDIEKYHPLGISKAEAISKRYAYTETTAPSNEAAQDWARRVQGYTVKRVIIV